MTWKNLGGRCERRTERCPGRRLQQQQHEDVALGYLGRSDRLGPGRAASRDGLSRQAREITTKGLTTCEKFVE